MKAITLYEPWATFIMLGWKTIETRIHKRFAGLVRETILIHAAKKFEHSWTFPNYLDANQYKTYYKMLQQSYFDSTHGHLLGSVYVNEFRVLCKDDSKAALINCDAEYGIKYGLFLERPCPLIKPIPYKGHQGIFNVPDEIIAAG